MDEQRAHDAHYGMSVPGLPGRFYPTFEPGSWRCDLNVDISDGERVLLNEVQRLRHLLRWEQVKDTYAAPNRKITVEFKHDPESMKRGIRQWLDTLEKFGDDPEGGAK